jgi:hypothetical protein
VRRRIGKFSVFSTSNRAPVDVSFHRSSALLIPAGKLPLQTPAAAIAGIAPLGANSDPGQIAPDATTHFSRR